MAMSLACVGVVLCHGTLPVRSLERRDFPLSGAFAGAAFLAFLARELCDSLSRKQTDRSLPSAPPVDEGNYSKVSKQEFMSFMEQEFDRLDKDKLGELDIDQVLPGKLVLGGLTRDRQLRADHLREPSGAGS